MGLILLILIILLLAGVWPSWPHRQKMGLSTFRHIGTHSDHRRRASVAWASIGRYSLPTPKIVDSGDHRIPVFILTTVHCMAVDL